jgi:ferritin-like metal-binding protein YciE
MKIETLRDCFLLKTQALYHVENQIVKALPKMIKNATNPKLQESLTDHLAETEEQIVRLEKIFEILDEKPKKIKVEGIRGIIEDGEWCMKQDTNASTLDTLIIGAGRHVEHYEISGYMALRDWARMLDMSEAESLIEETLEEEKNADSALSDVSAEIATEANDGSTDKALSTDNTEEEGDEDEEESTDEEE